MPRKPRPRTQWGAKFNMKEFEEQRDLVNATLNDHLECAPLNQSVRDALIAGLAHAVFSARAGVPAKRPDGLGKKWTAQVFMADVARAMKQAGLPTKTWRRDADMREQENYESLWFALTRELAEDTGLKLPLDLFRLAKQAETVCYLS
jgi:hypothetical protein